MQTEVPPVSELRFFTDRNLGARVLPGVLRAAGWNVVTMNEFYGAAAGERVDDVEWVADATGRGFILLSADSAMASVPREAQAIHMHSARVFAIARRNAQLRAAEQASLFLHFEMKIRQLSLRPGPYAFAIGRTACTEQRLQF